MAKQEQLLQEILDELRRDSTTEGSRAKSERSRLMARSAEPQDSSRIQESIEALEKELYLNEELSRAETRRFTTRVAQLEKQKELAQELAVAQEKYNDAVERGDLTDQMKYGQEVLETERSLNRLTDAQDAANKAAERGVAKFELVSNKFLKVEGAARDFAEHIPMSVSELKTFGLEMVDAIKSGEIFVDVFKKLVAEGFNLSMALDEVNANLSRSTGLFQETGTIMDQQARTIRHVERSNAILGVTTAEVGEVMGNLQRSMVDFTRMSKSDQDEILNTATVMHSLGVNAATSAQLFDKATKSLGYQNSEIRGIGDELHATSQSLGVPLEQVAADFNYVATELAFYGDKAIDVFKGLSKQSKATGLSMQQLLKISGKAFDTFDGAAMKVGRLNAILGGPYLNSIDMLNASEEERIEIIKRSMDASGRMFEDLHKFEQLAIADALGISQEEARRLFGELDAAQEMDIRQKEKMEETARKAQKTLDKLVHAFNSLIVSLDWVVGPFSWLVEKFSEFVATPVGKFIGQMILYIGGGIGALLRLGKTLTSVGTKVRRLGAFMRMKGFFGKETAAKVTRVGKAMTNTGSRMSSVSRIATSLVDVLKKIPSFKIPGGQALAQFADKFKFLQKWGLKVTALFNKIPFIGPKAAQLGSKQIGTKIPGLNVLIGLYFAAENLFDSLGRVKDMLSGDLGLGEGLVGIITDLSVGLFEFLDAISFGVGGLVTDLAFYVQEKVLGLPKSTKDAFIDAMVTVPETLEKIFLSGWDSFLFTAYQMMPDWLSSTLGFLGVEGPSAPIGGIITPGGMHAQSVNDAIITSEGQLIKPNPQDNIIAAKPDGPIMEALNPLSLLQKLASSVSPASPPTPSQQAAPNITVVVKVGEKEIKNLVVDTLLKDPEVSAMASGFGGR